METTFKQLNHGWNAEPNAPIPKFEWDGNDLKLTFFMNSFQFPEYNEGDQGEITFINCSRCRMGILNDEGWYRGQGRFKGIYHRWGEFYEVDGDLRLELVPDDWEAGVSPTTDHTHYLFYFRDNDFECDAERWELRIK